MRLEFLKKTSMPNPVKSLMKCYSSSITRPINPLSANPTKWSNTLKQFVGSLPTNCLSVFDHFVILALKGLKTLSILSDTTVRRSAVKRPYVAVLH